MHFHDLHLMANFSMDSMEHPSMPWWGTELGLDILRMAKSRKVKGSLEGDESVLQPEWSSTSDLFYLVTDQDGQTYTNSQQMKMN